MPSIWEVRPGTPPTSCFKEKENWKGGQGGKVAKKGVRGGKTSYKADALNLVGYIRMETIMIRTLGRRSGQGKHGRKGQRGRENQLQSRRAELGSY